MALVRNPELKIGEFKNLVVYAKWESSVCSYEDFLEQIKQLKEVFNNENGKKD